MTVTEEFLERVYTEKDDAAALDLIFNGLCDLLDGYDFQSMDEFMVQHGCEPVFGHKVGNPNFAAVNAIFKAVDLDRCSTTVMIGFLAAPCSAREELAEYKPLLARIREHLKKTESRGRVKALLQGFDR